jgi:SHS2 domain-containing protein
MNGHDAFPTNAVPAAQATQLPHGADIGVRGSGPSLAAAFAQAAVALTSAMVEPATIAPRESVPITCTAPDERLLLYDWLNAVIYEMAVRNMLFGRFDVSVRDHHLHAWAWGEPVDPRRHAVAVEPKGATMSGLKVCRMADGSWVAECVVDV